MGNPGPQTGHVGLNVTDLTRSTAFYQRVLGLEKMGGQTGGDRRYAFLGRDGALVLTLWQQSEGAFATELPGLHHLSFQVADLEAVHQAEAVLRELGVEPLHGGVVAHGVGLASGATGSLRRTPSSSRPWPPVWARTSRIAAGTRASSRSPATGR
jgi:lactoylglutathione lyase